ncbi:MAG: TetR/AcrR family transcriptional regulator [Actinomycetota bacterium]
MVKRRAKVEQTRRRIAKATYELHSTIGPAQATVTRISERSGLPRQTIYRNFPNTLELFHACISYGLERHPLPDPTPWSGIGDPVQRFERGLTDIYDWFVDQEGVMTNAIRDYGLFPEAAAAMQPIAEYFGRVHGALTAGWPSPAAAAIVGLAIDFSVWKKLREELGMQTEEIIPFWTRLAGCVS